MGKTRWDDEDVRTVEPDISKIQCKDCMFRMKPITICGETVDRCGYGQCDMYDTKPSGVLWNKEKCEYYEKESTE